MQTKRIRPNFKSPSKPSGDLLKEAAPADAWKLAIREATRSPMPGVYKTGAVIIDSKGKILVNGCSHPNKDGEMMTTHAERHALSGTAHMDLRDATCIVYTLNSNSKGCSWNSRPCLNCAQALVRRGVVRAIYPVRDPETGVWRIEEDLMIGVLEKEALGTLFAREFVR